MLNTLVRVRSLLRMVTWVMVMTGSMACSHADRFYVQEPDIIVPPSALSVEVPGLRWACSEQKVGVNGKIHGTWFGEAGPARPLRIDLDDKAWTKTDLQTFQQELDELQIGNCILPKGAVAAIQRIVAAAAAYAPRHFADDLDIRYGYNIAANRVDLLPGMRLRVLASNTRTPETPVHFWLSGTTEFDVLDSFPSDGKGWALDLAAPLSRLGIEPPTLVRSSDTKIQSVAGIGDLTRPPHSDESGNDRLNYRYWRIYYPSKVSKISSHLITTQLDEDGLFLVVRATQMADIKALPTYSDAKDKCEDANKPSINCLSFRNRAIPLPMIQIALNHEQLWVPVGTTLRDLIQQIQGPPPSTDLTVANVKERHQIDAVYFDSVLRRLRVERLFDGRPAILNNAKSCESKHEEGLHCLLLLPIAAGDRLSW